MVLLEEDSLSLEDNYFCHAKEPNSEPTKNPKPSSAAKCQAITSSSNISCCLAAGLQVILRSDATESSCFKEQNNKYLHCSRCSMTLGQKIAAGNSDQYLLWTGCLDVSIEELDVDGDFLRYIEKPLFDECLFYSTFISCLIDNQCYRIILSAITQNGCIDFMLLWLIDQKVRLYSASLPHPSVGPESSIGTRGTEGDVDIAKDLPSIPVTLEPCMCHRVFYRLLLPTDQVYLDDSQKLLKSWRHDFGVSLCRLPWELCIGLASCLQRFTAHMAPHLRRSDRQMFGFTSGAVPVAGGHARTVG